MAMRELLLNMLREGMFANPLWHWHAVRGYSYVPVPLGHCVHAALPDVDLKVPSAHGTHWPSTGPVKPAWHKQAETFVCLVLLCPELAGHVVQWLALNCSA